MTGFDISSIAIIGSGPGGLAALYEFLHTNKDGTSTVHQERSSDPAFPKVVAFEQKDKAGGIWASSLGEADLPVPPQDLLDTNNYHLPDVIHPRPQIPDNVGDATSDNPIVVKANIPLHELEWRRSGVYPDLFTNIPSRFIRYSYIPLEEKYNDKSRIIYPFLTHGELSNRISTFIESESLSDYIRTNSTVVKAEKNENGKWVLTVREKDPVTNTEKWYQEQFDAIVVANGHYTVPVFPKIEGLAEYNKKFPGVIVHTKSYRSQDEFKDKNVLVVGGSISTVNMLQYIVPVAKTTINSKRGYHYVFEWINDALVSEGIVPKPQIQNFDPETGDIHFVDGTVAKDIDKVVLTTGYHYHYPFLDGQISVNNPSNLSRVGGLYKDTFSIADATLATVGVAISALNFHTIEASAAAIAGVWSGAKTLPSQEEQQQDEAQLVNKLGDNLFYHYKRWDVVQKDFIDPLHEYSAINRANPLQVDGEFIHEIEEGIANLEKLYYNIKDQKITVKETLLV